MRHNGPYVGPHLLPPPSAEEFDALCEALAEADLPPTAEDLAQERAVRENRRPMPPRRPRLPRPKRR